MQNNFTYTKIVAILRSSQLHHSEVYNGNSAFAIILDHQFLEGECRILESLNTDSNRDDPAKVTITVMFLHCIAYCYTSTCVATHNNY